MDPITIALVGSSLIGGALNSRSQARQQREANRLQREGLGLQREGLNFAKGQYADRGQYRALLPKAISDSQRAGQVDYTERDRFVPIQSKYTAAYDDAIGALQTDAGRLKRVSDAMRDYDALDELEYGKRIKQVGGDAARLGRIGSGEAAEDVTGLGRELALRRDAQRNTLLRDAIEADLADRYKLVDVTRGRAGDDVALQQANQGMRRQLGLDAEGRADRKVGQSQSLLSLLAGLGFGGEGNVTNAYGNTANAYGNAANQQFGQASQSGQSAGDAFSSLAFLLANGGFGRQAPDLGAVPRSYSYLGALDFNKAG